MRIGTNTRVQGVLGVLESKELGQEFWSPRSQSPIRTRVPQLGRTHPSSMQWTRPCLPGHTPASASRHSQPSARVSAGRTPIRTAIPLLGRIRPSSHRPASAGRRTHPSASAGGGQSPAAVLAHGVRAWGENLGGRSPVRRGDGFRSPGPKCERIQKVLPHAMVRYCLIARHLCTACA